MKKLLLVSFMFLTGMLFAQTEQLGSYDAASADTNYWAFFDNHGGQHYQANAGASAENGWIKISYPSDNVHEGTGALRLDYSVHNKESWGGYTKLEHWNPDSNSAYDWSLYDSLSFWYNNISPQTLPGRVHLRVNLQDVSDAANGANTYDVGQTEYYYSFQYVLDSEPGWHKITIPLVNNYNWDGAGFNLTGWSGIKGNEVLDKDQIKGYSYEFSISGSGDGDFCTGSVLIDDLHLTGFSTRPWLIFNGKTVNNAFSAFTWGQSALEEIAGGGEDPKTNALLWTQGDEWANGWSGAGWNVSPPMNIAHRWAIDSLKFKAKIQAGTGPIRMQFESGANGVVGLAFTPIADDAWHEYALPLRDFGVIDNKPDFDPGAITVFQFMGEASAKAGQKILFDYIWTGSPVIDVSAPNAPAFVSAVAAGDFTNLVTWTDVPGESGEVYDVYYSLQPITDLTAFGVEVVASNVAENLMVAEHILRAPGDSRTIQYHYAVVCKDQSGNESELAATDAAVSNSAKGVTPIHPTAPANFVADGELGDWAGIKAFEVNPDNGTGFIVQNQKIDGAADCSMMGYVAFDAENMYVAFDVTDDIINTDNATTYQQDSPDLFIGLYDWHGASHTGLKRGDFPDYQMRFNRASAIIGNVGDFVMASQGDANYAWVEKFPSGYVVEGKFPLSMIAGAATPDDKLFVPIEGKRIKIDMSVNDADATGAREGILTYSPYNEDQSWSDVSRWLYTWIGTEMVPVGVEEDSAVPTAFNLDQNYPNPFNPSTQIKFSVAKLSDVSLKVYNMLGQEVANLINEVKSPGTYTISFDASNLATGIYVYQLTAGSFVSSKKMMLIK